MQETKEHLSGLFCDEIYYYSELFRDRREEQCLCHARKYQEDSVKWQNVFADFFVVSVDISAVAGSRYELSLPAALAGGVLALQFVGLNDALHERMADNIAAGELAELDSFNF